MRHSSSDAHGGGSAVVASLRKAWGPALLLGLTAFAASAWAADTRESVESALSKPAVRGGIVFKNYCVLCHGQRGDGQARATRLYGAENLSIKPQTPEHLSSIIRKGGGALGRSAYMPPWENELSEEQITDVIAYLQVVADPVRRGEVVFKTNCVLCHGVKGDGKGRASVLFNPPPADLTRSDKNDQYKEMIIRMGGEAMGRSPVMPVWGEQISDQEIQDVVQYLRTLLINRPVK